MTTTATTYDADAIRAVDAAETAVADDDPQTAQVHATLALVHTQQARAVLAAQILDQLTRIADAVDVIANGPANSPQPPTRRGRTTLSNT